MKPCMGCASRLEKDREPEGLAVLGQETNVVDVKSIRTRMGACGKRLMLMFKIHR